MCELGVEVLPTRPGSPARVHAINEASDLVETLAGVYDFVVDEAEMPRMLDLLQRAQGQIQFIEQVPEREPTGSTFADSFDEEFEV